MLLAAIILGVSTALLELSIYAKVRTVRQFISRFEWSGLVLSCALAVCLGHIFGAAGVTVMIGGVISMLLTQPIYLYINRGRRALSAKFEELKSWFKLESTQPSLS